MSTNNHAWLRGDAMYVALRLRGLVKGDEVIPAPSCLKLYSNYMCGQPEHIERGDVAVVEARHSSAGRSSAEDLGEVLKLVDRALPRRRRGVVNRRPRRCLAPGQHMKDHPWVRGDAMRVALMLRPLRDGDRVIPAQAALDEGNPPWANHPNDLKWEYTNPSKALVGRECLIDGRYNRRWEGSEWWVARTTRSGYGIWVRIETIEAWKPGS